MNTYGYAVNNPLIYVDPNGLFIRSVVNSMREGFCNLDVSFGVQFGLGLGAEFAVDFSPGKGSSVYLGGGLGLGGAGSATVNTGVTERTDSRFGLATRTTGSAGAVAGVSGTVMAGSNVLSGSAGAGFVGGIAVSSTMGLNTNLGGVPFCQDSNHKNCGD